MPGIVTALYAYNIYCMQQGEGWQQGRQAQSIRQCYCMAHTYTWQTKE